MTKWQLQYEIDSFFEKLTNNGIILLIVLIVVREG